MESDKEDYPYKCMNMLCNVIKQYLAGTMNIRQVKCTIVYVQRVAINHGYILLMDYSLDNIESISEEEAEEFVKYFKEYFSDYFKHHNDWCYDWF